LELIAAALPRRARVSLDLTDPAAESGLETIVRVIAVRLGFRVSAQVRMPGVGRIDLMVEDWIAVETDGAAFHDVAVAGRDRRRDALLAATGRSVLRPGYSLVVHDPATVARQLIGAVETHRRVQDSGRLAARARTRLERLGLA
jgi:very-short-patch-repair endonuclease